MIRNKFDKDNFKSKDPEPVVKRLQNNHARAALKPATPRQLVKDRTRKGSARKFVVGPNQTLILDYYRERMASENASSKTPDNTD